ncbi:MAG: flagellar biosynthetic protein FliR [Planctomycetota bacterium]|nr:flagellar biosynthetic protein FliR [Planctomycetota bacterium]
MFQAVEMEEFPLPLEFSQRLAAIAILIGLRVIPVFILLPLGKHAFRWQAKLALSVLLTTLLTTFHSENATLLAVAGTSVLPTLDIAVSELLAGLAIGTSILIAIEGIQLGSQWIGLSSGIRLQGNNNTSALAKLIWLTVFAGLVTAGIHGLIISALLDWYTWLPVGSFRLETLETDAFTSLSMALTWSFILGLKLAAPAMITMLATNLTVGWISRQAPQFHQFVLGLPANTAVLLTVVMLTLGTMTLAMQQ